MLGWIILTLSVLGAVALGRWAERRRLADRAGSWNDLTGPAARPGSERPDPAPGDELPPRPLRVPGDRRAARGLGRTHPVPMVRPPARRPRAISLFVPGGRRS
jgi:hypothetical protein